MQFAAPRRRDPFGNRLLSLVMHLVVTTALVVAAYFALANAMLTPFYVVLAIVSVIEGLWFYFLLRR